MGKSLNKGKFIKALVAECFDCKSVITLLPTKGIAPLTREEAEQQLNTMGWSNTPRGFYCAACRERDANEMIAAVDEMLGPSPQVVDAEKSDGKFIVIEPSSENYRAIKRQFVQSVEACLDQLRALDLLLDTAPTLQFGEYTHQIYILLENMIEIKRASIKESIESLKSGIADLERNGY